MLTKNSVLFSTVLILFSLHVGAFEWQQQVSDGALAGYDSPTPDSDFVTIKITARVKADLSRLIAVHQDVDRIPEWGQSLESVELVDRLNQDDYTLRFFMAAPWPVQHRELVFRSLVTRLQDSARIDFESVINTHPNSDYVQVKRVKGYWLFEKSSDGFVDIEYVNFCDPGGNLPAWLVNMKALEIPFNTFKAMLDHVDASY